MIITNFTATLMETLKDISFMIVCIFILKEAIIKYKKYKDTFLLFTGIAFAVLVIKYLLMILSHMNISIHAQFDIFMIPLLKTAATMIIIFGVYNEIIYTILQKIQKKKVITIFLTMIATTLVVLNIIDFIYLKITAINMLFETKMTFALFHQFLRQASMLHFYCFFTLLIVSPIAYYLMIRTRMKKTLAYISASCVISIGALALYTAIRSLDPISTGKMIGGIQWFYILRAFFTFAFEMFGFYIAFFGLKRL